MNIRHQNDQFQSSNTQCTLIINCNYEYVKAIMKLIKPNQQQQQWHIDRKTCVEHNSQLVYKR